MSVVAASSAGSVRFDIPGAARSARLVRRLARRANVMLHPGKGEHNTIVAELGDQPDDLAALLREVETWVEEESLAAIRFELDGRAYVLEAGETDWTSVKPEPVGSDVAARRRQLRHALDSVDVAMEELGGREGSTSRPDMRGLEGLRAQIELALRLLD